MKDCNLLSQKTHRSNAHFIFVLWKKRAWERFVFDEKCPNSNLSKKRPVSKKQSALMSFFFQNFSFNLCFSKPCSSYMYLYQGYTKNLLRWLSNSLCLLYITVTVVDNFWFCLIYSCYPFSIDIDLFLLLSGFFVGDQWKYIAIWLFEYIMILDKELVFPMFIW